jgi:hypothetical protein
MRNNLAKVFIQKGIIRRGSVFECWYSTKGISGQCDASVLGSFKLIGAQSVGDWVYFNTIGPDDKQYRIRSDLVKTIDGMTAKNVAESHQLTEDGDDYQFIRRGRRRKDDICDDEFSE